MLIATALLALACPGPAPTTDGGSGTDVDAGVAVDAGGTAVDAGATVDAGTAVDAGSGATDAGSEQCTEAELSALEASIAAALDAAATNTSVTSNPDFTMLLETNDGRSFSHSHGTSSPTTVYESASTSKWVSAAVLLSLVDQGKLTLASKPHDSISWWAETTVTLESLLSFRSGFSNEASCINRASPDYEACTRDTYDENPTPTAVGTVFQYSGSHMQIAGLMAMKATGKTWEQIFAGFKTDTGLFTNGLYDLPSASNPRLAGGMHWRADEYLGFLRKLARGQVLSDEMRAQMFKNHRGSATLKTSPVLGGDIAEDWAYGLGNWLECKTAKQPNTYNCGEGHRNSSAGAYGSYPFIDFDNRYFGIVAEEGKLGSGDEGVKVFRVVEPLVVRWVKKQCP